MYHGRFSTIIWQDLISYIKFLVFEVLPFMHSSENTKFFRMVRSCLIYVKEKFFYMDSGAAPVQFAM